MNTLARNAAQDHAYATARSAAGDVYGRMQRSTMFANGALLIAAGFFGLFNVLTLHLPATILSAYVILFGLLMCGFATGLGQDRIRKFFGFLHSGHGQLVFLLVAGNLSWTAGTLGIVAAVATNAHGVYAWRRGGEKAGLAAAEGGFRAGGVGYGGVGSEWPEYSVNS
mmetsp:Transcript_186/g.638  ORF Transcript_186/g.638 Transcript_186/m.638 type:complete len:168 (+) Transcript_186:79-582(+)|eukprot:CAMPEP_0202799860 /NCGR_PEP_ID=MMETSP1388-20130828/99292_1 /ASSEMBLY_ACC=CAM_ASM_000864 /TAXON_ID=37098 /ORGANISM="Isochrysis sp, Strain CCMP1244" /LENGTH=167 /DNA_ID=CAMNT_0049469825 /DNA_START=38 /DNA_END=541 /DNA_ORIENTATION=-